MGETVEGDIETLGGLDESTLKLPATPKDTPDAQLDSCEEELILSPKRLIVTVTVHVS